MRNLAKELISSLETNPGKAPKNVKVDYGAINVVVGSNTVIKFTTRFSQPPIVTVALACAWNAADAGLRMVALDPSSVTFVGNAAGTIHWMAIGS